MSLTISAADEIDFKPSGDNDDFISFVTAGNVPEIQASGANLKITATGGTINFDDEDLTTTGDITCDAGTFSNTVTMSYPTQDYVWTRRVNTPLALQCQGTNTAFELGLYTAAGDGADGISFVLYGTGLPSDIATYERLRIWFVKDPTNEWEIRTRASGTELPLNIYVYGNTNQLRLQNDGDIMMATIPTGATAGGAGAASNELWVTSSHASLPDGVVMRA
jgi:hypothetical protein